MLGTAYASSGNTTGVIGSTVSPNGIATFGDSTSTSGWHRDSGPNRKHRGRGGRCFRYPWWRRDCSCLALSGSAYYAQVFSVDAAGNGFYAGNLNVTGKLTKGSGSFKIDHPLDPANKYFPTRLSSRLT